MNKDFIKIIPSALGGDNSAFETLYNMTRNEAYFIALSLTHNENDAMDILQESYLKAFSNLDKVNPPELFDNWLNRIVANQSKDFLKKKKPVLFADISADIKIDWDENEKNEDYIPEQALDNSETTRLIMEIINTLPEDQRLCILMYYYQDMKVADIASSLELTVSTVKYKLSAARKTIKSEVERLEKKGTKLYAAFPFALLPSIINQAAQNVSAPAFSALSTLASIANGTANIASKTSTGGINMIFKTTMSKVIAAAVAVAVVGGGITAAVVIGNNNNTASSSKSTQTINSSMGTKNDDSSYEEQSDDTSTSENVDDNLDYRYDIHNGEVKIQKYFGTDTKVDVPSTIENTPVTCIDSGAFSENETITQVTVPDGIKTIGHEAFETCTALESVSLPEGLTEIDYDAFRECKSLTKINLPKSLTSIGNNAFDGCTALADVTLPENIEAIGWKAFNETSWYENLPDGEVYIGTIYFAYKGDKKVENASVTIKEGTTAIAGGAFDEFYGLTSVSMPDSLVYIGNDAFRYCSLTDVKWSNNIKIIGEHAFYSNEMKNVVLPNTVTRIEDNAFDCCSSLESITLPDTLEYLGKAAFNKCTALKTIKIPSGIGAIEGMTFYECESLDNVVIPSTVSIIGNEAFEYCSSLKNITISNGVRFIYGSAFRGCPSLTDITIPESVTDISEYAFVDSNSVKIHGKSGSEAEKFAETAGLPFIAE